MDSSCGRHDREWLDFVSDLVSRSLVCWPDEQVTCLLIETFDATAGAFFVQAEIEEVQLSRRLQRLLAGLGRQIATFSQWSSHCGPGAADAARAVHPAVHLAPCEIAVLELLSVGFTAASIGRRLHIAEGTVHKHLQHCYAKLGVTDRLAAVRTAQHIGLLLRP